jgi:G3E family GTPase
VLVNEFGHIGIDQEAFELEEGILVKELTGGCVCCTLAGQFTSTLFRLIHLAQPDRILIEPTGLGHPAGILDALQSPDLSRFIDVRATLCLIDPRLLDSPQTLASEAFQDQVNLADVLVLNKTDLAPAELTAQAKKHGENLFPPKQQVVATEQGRIAPAMLDLVREGHYHARFPAYHQHSQPSSLAEERVELSVDQPIRQMGRAYGHISCGWIFHYDRIFQQETFRFLQSIGPVIRVKGVFRMDQGWALLNRIDDETSVIALAYRRDSRLEIISESELDWDKIEETLLLLSSAGEN